MAKAKGKTAKKSKSAKATKTAKARPKARKAAKPAKTAKAPPKAKAKGKAQGKAKAKAKPAARPKAQAKAKPKAAPRAQPRPMAEAPNGVSGGIAYAELARTGNLDALFALMDTESASKNDRTAYKWLAAASDFGHDEAENMIGDVMEVSSLRYDDDAYETAAAHWELAVAYLEGGEGLPFDLALARKHLEEAFRDHDLEGINAGTKESYAAEPVLARLSGDARALLEAALAGGLGRGAEADEGDEDDGGAILGGAGTMPVAEEEEEHFQGGDSNDEDEDDEDEDGA